MKRITLLLSFLAFSFGFSQELVTNGGFDSGSTGWTGNAVNVVDQGGNFVNEANVAAPANPWDANISYVLSLTAGTSYTFSFRAWTDATTASRTIIAGIGLNQDPWSAATVTETITDTPQVYSYTLVAPTTSANSRVLFDMGAAAGFVFIDDVSLMEVTPTCSDGIQNGDETGVDCGGSMCSPCAPTGPSVAAPTPPARPTGDVYSIFSDAYSDVAVDNWGPDWGPSSARINDIMVDGNATKEIDYTAGKVFAGIDFSTSSAFDATNFTYIHIDYYIESPLPTGQVLNTKLSNHANGSGETSAIQDTRAPAADQWVQLDIPLADFVAASNPPNLDRDAIAQIVITAARADSNEPLKIYMDNIYFHKNTELSVEENEIASFSVFPNPTASHWNVKSNHNINSIDVFDVLGKQVLSIKPNAQETVINASPLNAGLYLARLTSDAGTETVRLVKN